jgi:hypothetical protein
VNKRLKEESHLISKDTLNTGFVGIVQLKPNGGSKLQETFEEYQVQLKLEADRIAETAATATAATPVNDVDATETEEEGVAAEVADNA